MSEERDLRVALRDILLEMYGLLSEKPEVRREPRRTKPTKPSPIFSTGTAPKPTGFASEPAPLPGRKAILVGTSIRMADQRRAGPGARLPGESDRDFVTRRKMIAAAHSRGLAPPETEQIRGANSTDEYWEMGH